MGQASAWADIDNDGDLDIAFSYSYPSLFKIYRNDSGSFTDITAGSGLNTIGASSILWAEINGDEYTDMFTGSYVYQNNGNGTFASLGQVAGHTSSLADFDMDGNVDILDISPPAIKFGNGNGTFGNEYSLPANNIISSVCFDFDNDGYAEIIRTDEKNSNTTIRIYKKIDGSFFLTNLSNTIKHEISGKTKVVRVTDSISGLVNA